MMDIVSFFQFLLVEFGVDIQRLLMVDELLTQLIAVFLINNISVLTLYLDFICPNYILSVD